MRQIPFGRGTVVLIGNLELGRHAPEALEIVVAPGLFAENVHDKAAEIEQCPFSGAMSLPMLGGAAGILVELPLDFGGNGLHLLRAGAPARQQINRLAPAPSRGAYPTCI